jgi:hypothetical protein
MMRGLMLLSSVVAAHPIAVLKPLTGVLSRVIHEPIRGSICSDDFRAVQASSTSTAMSA